MQSHVQQRTMDFNMPVVIDKAQFPEFVHEMTYPGPRGANHLRKCLLADFRQDRIWLIRSLTKIRKKQQSSR